MDFLSDNYLSNSERRIAYLQEVVAGRTVAILAAGASIEELENRICEISDSDICYFGFNGFVQENKILSKIDKHYSVYMDSCKTNVKHTFGMINTFLERNDDNLFISSFYNNAFELIGRCFDLHQFLESYDSKLLFFSLSHERTVPSRNRPLHFITSNSLLIAIQLAVIGKAERIVLFGADGGCVTDSKETYYHHGEPGQLGNFIDLCESSPREAVVKDTNTLFNPIAEISIRIIYQTYNLPPIEIINCSKNSLYTPFPKVSYDAALECLSSGKKFNIKEDLRIPKISVFTPCSNKLNSLKKTIKSISNQSFTSREHIIIHDEVGDKIKHKIGELPDVRWTLEKRTDFISIVEKGMETARGEYIVFCPVGSGYLNQDWYNSCVEVLENYPDISLVWGLSQYMSENGKLGEVEDEYFLEKPPPQGKYFIYYWLKKKSQFPQGSFCVRKSVLKGLIASIDPKEFDEGNDWRLFNYNFNSSGYLPYFIPVVAVYCAKENGDHKNINDYSENYTKIIKEFERALEKKETTYYFRNGSHESLPYGYSRIYHLIFKIGWLFNPKLPNVCFFIIEKALKIWEEHRWSSFRYLVVAVWIRLIGLLNSRNKISTHAG